MKSQTLFTAILVSGIFLVSSNFALAASHTDADRVNSEKTDKTNKTDRNKNADDMRRETDRSNRDENADDMRGIDGTVKDPDATRKQQHPSGTSHPSSPSQQSPTGQQNPPSAGDRPGSY